MVCMPQCQGMKGQVLIITHTFIARHCGIVDLGGHMPATGTPSTLMHPAYVASGLHAIHAITLAYRNHGPVTQPAIAALGSLLLHLSPPPLYTLLTPKPLRYGDQGTHCSALRSVSGPEEQGSSLQMPW